VLTELIHLKLYNYTTKP